VNARTPDHDLLQVALDDKYLQREGTVFLSGTQALVRLPLQQRRRDELAGVNTAGYVSGYRGSPLGRFDIELWNNAELLKTHHVRFQPGINEDLAATALWGSQYVGTAPGARYDGVFGIWYGKGPGVDRSGDAFKHANLAGANRWGGVLAVAGDDHASKSSTTAHQSDQALIAAGIPVLYPSDVQDILDFGLHGIAMSRYSGCWVGLKSVTDVVESSGSVEVGDALPAIRLPEPPAEDLNIRGNDIVPLVQEARLYRHKLHAVHAYARTNRIDRVVVEAGAGARVGIVAAGKAYADLRQAMRLLGLDEDGRAEAAGLRVLKIGLVWPLDPEAVEAFADGLETVLVVEEKRALIESQLKSILYDAPMARKPRVVGKYDGANEWSPRRGEEVLASIGELSPPVIAEQLAALLGLPYERPGNPSSTTAPSVLRKATFCSGCPHSTSTRLPEGSRAIAGIGCHGMVALTGLDPYGTIGHMGAEGILWMGQAPFTDEKHIFANMGDGTYFHSGFLAIRQAVASKTTITYKILVNGFVSMTGGQPIEGELTVPQMVRELQAEGVGRIVVVADDPDKYDDSAMALPADVSVRHRRELDAVQRELREVSGVSVLFYDQVCATERRRLRKRGKVANATKQAFINAAVCEGCGDCGEASNCLSVEPLETEFGRKRRINQSSCNKDLSCVEGFCPSFVTVHGGRPRRSQGGVDGARLAEPPAPVLPSVETGYNVLITGIGGTGVVTLGAIVAMAAHLDGHAASALDVTGLAQKYGAVMSHVRVAASRASLKSARIAAGEADVVVGCDLVVSAGPEAVATMAPGRTRVAVNAEVSPTIAFAKNPDWSADADGLMARVRAAVGDPKGEAGEAVRPVNATALATALVGEPIAAGMFMLGYAWQRGWLPVSGAAMDRAIELNGVAVESNRRAFLWGRQAAHDPAAVDAAARPSNVVTLVPSSTRKTPALIAHRARALEDWQDKAYAARYTALVDRVSSAEARLGAGDRLTRAVARGYHKLLAYKDEFEVARLYADPQFERDLQAQFEGDYKLRFHLGAWPFARRGADGKVRKGEVGGWVLPAFKVLAKLRFLRGSLLDPFRGNEERRHALRDIADYERDVERLLAELDAGRLDTAVSIAELPDRIRGYGHVRGRSAEGVARQRAELWARWDDPKGTPAVAATKG
jgi:indolepyruvate ferredoxin oxidoreductase